VNDTAELPRIFKEAFHIASTGRPGPVLIDVPVDIQQNTIDSFTYPKSVHIIGYKPQTSGNAFQIKKAAAAIEEAKAPVICAGGGLFSGDAIQPFRSLVERTGIPCVCTMMGIGALPADHPQNLGMLGSHGNRAANTAVRKADLLILCGARVGDRAMNMAASIAERATVIHIDIDPAEIGKNIPADIPVVGNLRLVLSSLVELVSERRHGEWLKTCRSYISEAHTEQKDGCVEPRLFMQRLCEKMQPGGILVADVGQNQIWSATSFAVRDGRFLTSGGMGTMGYSVPAAMGAKLAKPQAQVVAVCGDGAFQMELMELATICGDGVDVKIVVMSNSRLGMVRELQDKLYGGRHAATVMRGNPDFIKLAGAYGISARRISSDGDIDSAIDEMLSCNGPYLLECEVDPGHSSL
jgi:acetolactate synthase-1/2/3 large subunit